MLAILAAVAFAAGAAPKVDFKTMTLAEGALVGPGAEAMLDRLAKAQFVLIGEDHGFADPPLIAQALARAGRKHGLDHHVVETGPLSEVWASDHLRKGGPDALAAALQGRPLAVPFVSMREDAELAAEFLKGRSRNDDPIWGVDQEFVGAPLIFLERLAAIAPTPAAKSLSVEALAAEKAAFASGNLGAIFLMTAKPETFARFEEAFSGSTEALTIIAALKESAAIYRSYSDGKNYASNADRIALIRRQFLAEYGQARGDAPRALLKMGAIHLGLGTTALNTFDLGSLTEGIAAANGLDVLRILILPLEGRQTQIRPSADGAFKIVDARPAEAAQLIEAIGLSATDIPAKGYAVIELETARRALEQEGLSKLSAEQRFFLLGYDYFVTTKDAKAATPLAE